MCGKDQSSQALPSVALILPTRVRPPSTDPPTGRTANDGRDDARHPHAPSTGRAAIYESHAEPINMLSALGRRRPGRFAPSRPRTWGPSVSDPGGNASRGVPPPQNGANLTDAKLWRMNMRNPVPKSRNNKVQSLHI